MIPDLEVALQRTADQDNLFSGRQPKLLFANAEYARYMWTHGTFPLPKA